MQNFSGKKLLHDAHFFMIFKNHLQNRTYFFLMHILKMQHFIVEILLFIAKMFSFLIILSNKTYPNLNNIHAKIDFFNDKKARKIINFKLQQCKKIFLHFFFILQKKLNAIFLELQVFCRFGNKCAKNFMNFLASCRKCNVSIINAKLSRKFYA